MKTVVEPLTEGLVTSKDPRNLSQGELSGGTNGWYVDLHDGIAPRPDPFLTPTLLASGGSVDGLDYMCFQNGTERVLAETSASGYRYFTLDNTNVVSSVTSLGVAAYATAGHTLVSYEDKYILLSGNPRSVVIRNDLSTRNLGLLPVIAAPVTITATAAASTWTAGATGYFDYWYTEVAELAGTLENLIVESSYEAVGASSTPQEPGSASIAVGRAYIPSFDRKVTLNLPTTPRNTEATHYYVYRSEAKELAQDPGFPNGERIARVSITAPSNASYITVVDGAETEAGPWYPVSASATGWGSSSFPTMTSGTTSFSDGVVTATGASNNLRIRWGGFVPPTGLVFTQASQLKVQIRAKIAYPAGAVTDYGVAFDNIQVSVDNGTTFTATTQAAPALATAYATLETEWTSLGHYGFTPAELAQLVVFAKLNTTVALATGGTALATATMDGFRVAVKTDGTGGTQLVPYPGIAIKEGSSTTVSSRGGQPPQANLGCMFNGMLLTNDLALKNRLRWSFPGKIDAFPTLYYALLETGAIDEIVGITTVNNVCVALLKQSIVRINYLPTEDDASFGRNRIWDFINSRVGCVNKNAWTKIVTSEGEELLVFVGPDGTYATDGNTCLRYDLDLNFWDVVDTTVDPDATHVILGADHESRNIMLHSMGASAGQVVPMSFSPRHQKDGHRFKIGLPWTAFSNNHRSVLGFRDKHNQPYYMVGLSNGTIITYKAAQLRPTSSSLACTSAMTLYTRVMNFEGIGQEYRVDDVYLQSVGQGTGRSLNIYSEFTDGTSTSNAGSKTLPASNQAKVHFIFMAENLKALLTGNAYHDVYNSLTFVYDDQWGSEDHT